MREGSTQAQRSPGRPSLATAALQRRAAWRQRGVSAALSGVRKRANLRRRARQPTVAACEATPEDRYGRDPNEHPTGERVDAAYHLSGSKSLARANTARGRVSQRARMRDVAAGPVGAVCSPRSARLVSVSAASGRCARDAERTCAAVSAAAGGIHGGRDARPWFSTTRTSTCSSTQESGRRLDLRP